VALSVVHSAAEVAYAVCDAIPVLNIFMFRAFASRLSAASLLILAVTEYGANAFFENEHSQNLLTNANEFADIRNASFITTCTNFEQQCEYCVPFSVWFKLGTLADLEFKTGLEMALKLQKFKK